ncbi:Fimbrial protein precursor [compost metagenome]
MKADKGFTIVELLIVIVIIGILAAITIVAYNGIQNRGKTAAGQALANSIVKKAEAYATINSSYPSSITKLTNNESPTSTTAGSGGSEAKLDDTTSVTATAMSSTVADGGKVVQYTACTAGANVTYWDFAKSPAGIVVVKAGPGC